MSAAAESAQPLRVSVVVPAYNAEKTLAACLRALTTQQGLPEPLEIIVVDDGSKDGTATLAQSFSGVTVLRQANAGPGAARNAGAAGASGDVVIFTDSDCIPAPSWAAEMLEAFRSHPDVALVMGRTRTEQSRGYLDRVQQGSDLVALEPGPATRFNSNNLGLRGELARDRPFDAALRIYGEDTDLGWRVLGAGKKTLFWPRAELDHGHPHTLRSFLREGFMQGWGAARLHYKHGKGLPRDLAFGVIALFAALGAALPLPGLRALLLSFAGLSFALFLVALLANELVYKRKSLALSLFTFPMQLVWYAYKLAGYLHMMLRIATGQEPAVVASKRELRERSGRASSAG